MEQMDLFGEQPEQHTQEYWQQQGFNKDQAKYLAIATKFNIDTKWFKQPGFTSGQMDIIFGGLMEHIDVAVYAKPEYDVSQMRFIMMGCIEDLDFEIYANTKFSAEQMYVIYKGLHEGVNAKVYACAEFTPIQMQLALNCLKQDSTFPSEYEHLVTVTCDERLQEGYWKQQGFNDKQINELILGTKLGLDVSVYAKLKYDYLDMELLRQRLIFRKLFNISVPEEEHLNY